MFRLAVVILTIFAPSLSQAEQTFHRSGPGCSTRTTLSGLAGTYDLTFGPGRAIIMGRTFAPPTQVSDQNNASLTPSCNGLLLESPMFNNTDFRLEVLRTAPGEMDFTTWDFTEDDDFAPTNVRDLATSLNCAKAPPSLRLFWEGAIDFKVHKNKPARMMLEATADGVIEGRVDIEIDPRGGLLQVQIHMQRSGPLALPLVNPGMTNYVPSNDEAKLARDILAEAQEDSIRENVEFCGYIGYDKAGKLVATPPTRGNAGSCTPDKAGIDDAGIKVRTASYHTHAAYDPGYSNEIPSVEDYDGDKSERINGYVATPAGRIWFLDPNHGKISQLCGEGCLPSDRAFCPGFSPDIPESYTYKELVKYLK